MSTLKSKAAITAFLAASAFAVVAPAQAKQCVFNKGGYVLHVHWHQSADVIINQTPNDQTIGDLITIAAPVRTAALSAGMADCTQTHENLVAVVAVVGALGVNFGRDSHNVREPGGFVSVGTRLRTYATHAVNGQRVLTSVAPLNCTPPSSPGYCRWSRVSHDLVAPPGKVVLVTQPSPHQYLDFFGSIFDIQWATGGLIQ